MNRIKFVNGIVTPLTAAEELERDAEEAAWAAEQLILNANAYKAKRAGAYPPIGDQLDALFHAGVFPAEMAAKLQAVKDKYPKT